jgi:prolyl oligopeptidase
LVRLTVRRLVLSTVLAVPSAIAATVPPVAQIRPVTDHYGATTLIDNYRWMEAEPNPELRAFMTAETAEAIAALARLPARQKLAHAIAALDFPAVVVPSVVQDGDSIFYLYRGPSDDVARLMVRGIAGGEQHLLVDPEALPDAPMHSEIGAFAPSPDGSYVAYALANAGPDSTVLRVHNVGSGDELVEHLADARFAAVTWQADSTSFYYTRPVVLGAGAAAAPDSRWRHLGVFLHKLGTSAARDVPVLDAAHLPFPFHGQHIIPRLLVPPASDYALAVITDGVSPEIAVYAVPASQLAQQPAPWVAISPQGAGATQVAVSGSLAFLLTRQGAPTFRVISEDMADPGIDHARTVLPADQGVITGIAAASDALFAARRQGVGMHLLRLDYHASVAEEVRLPFEGTIKPSYDAEGGLVADPRGTGALFSLESWVHPRTWLRFDTHMRHTVDAGLVPPPPQDFSGYQATETTATARDGTKIPLSIITRRDIALDHARPALVEAYGSYGYAYDPRYLPEALAWADQGGVYAVAHVRGGGELGPPWHAAGQFANKPNSITDFLTCAATLTALGYSDAAHRAALGTNAGAIVVGGAITWQPAAFRAAVLRDGLLNPLRSEDTGNPESVLEFGSAHDLAQFPNLLPIDAYSQIKEGIEYPAVLLSAHIDDPMVPSWQSAKMAARLSAATTSGYPVLLRVAGDGPPLTRAARAQAQADDLAFLLWQLGAPDFQPSEARSTEKKSRKTSTSRHSSLPGPRPG